MFFSHSRIFSRGLIKSELNGRTDQLKCFRSLIVCDSMLGKCALEICARTKSFVKYYTQLSTVYTFYIETNTKGICLSSSVTAECGCSVQEKAYEKGLRKMFFILF